MPHRASQFIEKLMGWKWLALDVLSKNIAAQAVYSDSAIVLAAKTSYFHMCFQIYLNQIHLGSMKYGLSESSHRKTDLTF